MKLMNLKNHNENMNLSGATANSMQTTVADLQLMVSNIDYIKTNNGPSLLTLLAGKFCLVFTFMLVSCFIGFCVSNFHSLTVIQAQYTEYIFQCVTVVLLYKMKICYFKQLTIPVLKCTVVVDISVDNPGGRGVSVGFVACTPFGYWHTIFLMMMHQCIELA